MARLNKRQRIRQRRDRIALLDKDAAMLPTDGAIAALVVLIDAELSLCVAAGRAAHETVPFLHPLGEQAFQLTGSVRGMTAVSWKAAGMDAARAAARRDMIDAAWIGIGDERGIWTGRQGRIGLNKPGKAQRERERRRDGSAFTDDAA